MCSLVEGDEDAPGTVLGPHHHLSPDVHRRQAGELRAVQELRVKIRRRRSMSL